MFRHILIPTDGTEHARSAIRHGLGLAASLDAKVTVLRVSGTPANIVIGGLDLTALPADVAAEISRQIDRHFDWVRQEAAKVGVSCVTVRAQAERPWIGILVWRRALVDRWRGLDVVN